MITQNEIERFAQNKYQAFLRSVVEGCAFFPLHVRFGRPRHTESLEILSKEIQSLLGGSKDLTGHGYTVICESVPMRRYGQQTLPVDVFFASDTDYVAFIGKRAEVEQFRQNVETSRSLCPPLDTWLATHVTLIIANADRWLDLMRVCAWFASHPRPGCYAREIPVPVHTKFIEENQAVLRNLLEQVLPNDFDPEADDFFSRFYLRDKEPLIRVRILDCGLATQIGLPITDFSVPVSAFNSLPFSILKRVIITENELPLLTLPSFPGTVAVFGRGNAVKLVAMASWLQNCPAVFYWGDIDAAGFTILAQLRKHLPHVRSVLMDRATFDGNAWAKVQDPSPPASAALQDTLTEEEWLCWRGVVATATRLEQERITLMVAHQAIQEAFEA